MNDMPFPTKGGHYRFDGKQLLNIETDHLTKNVDAPISAPFVDPLSKTESKESSTEVPNDLTESPTSKLVGETLLASMRKRKNQED